MPTQCQKEAISAGEKAKRQTCKAREGAKRADSDAESLFKEAERLLSQGLSLLQRQDSPAEN